MNVQIRLPVWFRQEIPGPETLGLMRRLKDSGINTVCRQAKCPNAAQCFGRKELTFMILGEACSRTCGFCNIADGRRKPRAPDSDEPLRIAAVVESLGLDYVVVTSVTRDDLSDGGAGQFVKTVRAVRRKKRDAKIELLIPDFQGKIRSLEAVVSARPDVVGHNLETVARLYPVLRPQADYRRSLSVLKGIKELNPLTFTKSSLMLGLGETEEEVCSVLRDLRDNLCDILTLGQYLAPTPGHYPVKEFVARRQFARYREIGLRLGFKAVSSGPKMRSSFAAGELYRELEYA
ncbi:MAG: lipoyl synthase [Candidatus Omnitrophica bacterium]|nr:lipoyl synthase [Candidatus Omnitrophota bacterium]